MFIAGSLVIMMMMKRVSSVHCGKLHDNDDDEEGFKCSLREAS